MRTLLFVKENKAKVKLVEYLSTFSKYNIINKKETILEVLQLAKEKGAPFDLLIIEMEEIELNNPEFIERIREAEQKKQIGEIKIIILFDINLHYKFEDKNSLNADACLLNPFENIEFEDSLSKLGFDKVSEDKKHDTCSNEIVDLKRVIYNNSKLNDQEFRVYIEKKVKKIGNAGEELLGEFLCSDHIEFLTRINLIRVAGYVRTPILLDFLESNLKNKNNITIIKETIIAICKFNNLESIRILNNALGEIGNTLLIRKINEEIGKIKQNNPILGLLPRFLEGEKDIKKFRVTVNILKEILSLSDSNTFVEFMSNKSAVISEGTFEILSAKGDSSIHVKMSEYFKNAISDEDCMTLPECSKISRLSFYYKNYFHRFPGFVSNYTEEIKNILIPIQDSEVRKNLISILAGSTNDKDIDFVKTIYNKDKDLQNEIIIQFSNNKSAVSFLYENYKSDTKNAVLIIKALLNTSEGINYFMENFFNEEADIQETIIRNIFIKDTDRRMVFVDKVFNSQLFNIKRIILTRILDFYDFSLKSILFNEKFDREFFSIEKEYLLAVTTAFPITLIERLMYKMSTTSFPLSKIKRFLATIQEIQEKDPLILFKNENMLIAFLDSIISKNSKELNLTTLNILGNFVILDVVSYGILTKGLNYFYSKRGNKITPKETSKIYSIRKFYISHFKDIKKKGDFIKEFKEILSKKPINFDQLRHFLKYSNMAIALEIDEFINILVNTIQGAEPRLQAKWGEFLGYFPFLKKIFQERINNTNIKEGNQRKNQQFIRIVIAFDSYKMSVLIFDQLKLLFPEYNIKIDPDKLENNDILLCDSIRLKAYIGNHALKTANIFLLLENNFEFASFKKFNPKFFVKPLSLNKIAVQLYQNLYFINEKSSW